MNPVVTPSERSWSIPLTTPVAVIPERKRHPAPPSADLLAAVIQVAATDATYDGDTGREAREWFASDSYAPYSYLWACDVLHLDADAIRARVLAQPLVPQPAGRSTGQSHHATAGGCRVLGCGWVGVDICTDPARHNPACVARGDSRVVVPVIQRITPKCQLCGVEVRARYEVRTRSGRKRVCASCVEAVDRAPKWVDPQVIERERVRDAIYAEAKRIGGMTPARARVLTGLSKGTISTHLCCLVRDGRLHRVKPGVYEVIR